MFKFKILSVTLFSFLLFSCQNQESKDADKQRIETTVNNFWTEKEQYEFKGLGTEPFWSFTINDKNFHFKTLSDQIEEFNTELKEDEFTKKSVSFTAKWQQNSILISIKENSCNDGMSDINYSHQVYLKITDKKGKVIMEENGCGYFLDGNENQFREEGTALTEEELMEYYIRDWEDQLVYEGKLGRPCDFSEGDYQENAQRWIKENPDQIRGFPVDWKDIKIEKYDFDKDGKIDYLFSFQEEPCAMSNAIPKKYVKIVYANEEQSNSNILETVHQLIAIEFSKKYPNLKLRKDDYLNIIDYETIKNGELIGEATLYEENDYKTSPSFGADYKYNPHLNKIKVDFYKN